MKKQVTILQENSSPLIVDDVDEREIGEYTDSLAKILENNNVTLLHTTSCSIIIRPHKITSIVVKDMSESQPTDSQPTKAKEEKQSEEPKENPDDGIISD
jgi:hypothetical protein